MTNFRLMSLFALFVITLSVPVSAGGFGFDLRTRTFGALFRENGVKGYFGSFFIPESSSAVIDNRMLNRLGLNYRIADFRRRPLQSQPTVRFEVDSAPRVTGITFQEFATSIRSGQVGLQTVGSAPSSVELVYSDAAFDIEN